MPSRSAAGHAVRKAHIVSTLEAVGLHRFVPLGYNYMVSSFAGFQYRDDRALVRNPMHNV